MIFSHVLFAGPSLYAANQVDHLNYLELRPPAAAGDIINYLTDNPYLEVLILADGYFFSKYATLHRELQLALKASIKVIGCSSIGALRAVELADDGMEGYGVIYNYYSAYSETPDDEVSLLHSESIDSYRPLSVPLINLRLLYRRTRSKRLRKILRTIIPFLEKIPFHQRSWDFIARIVSISACLVDDDFLYLKSKYVDYKQLDLSNLLKSLPMRQQRLLGIDRFKSIDLQDVREFIQSGQYRTNAYVLAPFRNLCNLPDESNISELDLRDLYLLFNSSKQISKDIIYNQLLLNEALGNGLLVTWDDINELVNRLLEVYEARDIFSLCRIYRLSLYEICCYLYMQCLIAHAEELIKANFMRAINMEILLNTLRSQSRLPSQLHGLKPSELQRLIEVSKELRDAKSRGFLLQLINAGFFSNEIDLGSPHCDLEHSISKSKIKRENHEFLDLITRLSVMRLSSE